MFFRKFFRKFLRNFIPVIILAITATMAQAQFLDGHGRSRAGFWEFTMQSVYSASQSIEGAGGSSLDLQDNLGWGFGLSYHFNDHFNLGMDFSWSSINYNARIIDEANPDDLLRYSEKLDLNTTSFTGKWNIMKGPMTPYVSGSIGWTLVDTNVFAGYEDGCYWYPWWGYVCGPVATSYGTNATSYGLGLGGRYEVTPKFSISASYDYKWLDIDAIDGSSLFRVSFGFLH